MFDTGAVAGGLRTEGGVMGFRNSKRQTFIITPFAADLPSGENLQK